MVCVHLVAMRTFLSSESVPSELIAFLDERLDRVRDPWAIVFDFDGVLVAKTEDWIYRLEPTPCEEARFQEMARKLRIDIDGYDPAYQRHLLYQAAAARLGIAMEMGPAAGMARRAATRRAKVFILTARSSPAAVRRMMQFLAKLRIRPSEIFQVGRTTKDRQINLVLESLPNHRVMYIDDSTELIANATRSRRTTSRLETVYIDYSNSSPPEATLRQLAWRVIQEGAERYGRRSPHPA